jgi:hypothetical protein
MQFRRYVDKNAVDEVMLYPTYSSIFSQCEYFKFNEWCIANTRWYYILMEDYVLFTNEDDVTLFLLTWSD